MQGPETQSSMFSSHVAPVKPVLQEQVKLLVELSDLHVPPF